MKQSLIEQLEADGKRYVARIGDGPKLDLSSPLPPALHRKFAKTQCDEQNVIAFVQKHGFLGSSHISKNLWVEEAPFEAELFTDWYRAILDMRNAVDLWECIQAISSDVGNPRQRIRPKKEVVNNYLGALRQRIKWDKDRVHYNINDSGYVYTQEEPKSTDIKSVALRILECMINEQLLGEVIPRFVVPGGHSGGGRLFQQEPQSLHGALWAQFAASLYGGERYNDCQYCGEPYSFKRDTSKFCSDSCRVMASKTKKSKRRK